MEKKRNEQINKKQVIKILRKIDILCDKNEQLALQRLNALKEKINVNKYKVEIKYIQNKINEKIIFNNLSDKKKEYYNICLENGRKAYQEGNLEEALVCYETGKYVTNHPVFNYYIGKIYYKKKNHEKAKEYLSIYEKNGGEKLSKTYLYMYHISRVTNTNDYGSKEYSNLVKLCKTYDVKHNFRVNKISEKENIQLEESDFTEKQINTKFEIELERIKELYMCGSIKTADKLLNELEKTTTEKEEKEKIKTLSKNKTLYKNKNK